MEPSPKVKCPRLRVETDKDTYLVGEPIQFRVFKKNLHKEPIPGGIYEIERIILNSMGEVIRETGIDLTWPVDFKIMPMEEVEVPVPLVWSQTDKNGKQVPPDPYTINLNLDGITIELQVMIISSD